MTYQIQFSGLQQLLSLDGVLLDMDSDREDGMGARGLGIEQRGGRLSLGTALIQDRVDLIFGVDLQLLQSVDNYRPLHISHTVSHTCTVVSSTAHIPPCCACANTEEMYECFASFG